MSDSLKGDKLGLEWYEDHGPVYQEDTKRTFLNRYKTQKK